MDEAQRADVRARLERLRDELREEDPVAEAASRPVELDQASVGRLSRMNAMQGQAMALETARRKALQLRGVLAALRRLESGDYGYCTDCDEQIDPRRLQFDPAIPRCLGCAERNEG